MATFKIELRDITKAETSIRYVIHYDGLRFRYQLGFNVPVKMWDDKDWIIKPKKTADKKKYEVLNSNITMRIAVCKAIFQTEYNKATADGKILATETLKQLIDAALNQKRKSNLANSDLYNFVNGFIKQAKLGEKSDIKRNRTSNIYDQTLRRLQDFEKEERYLIRFSSIDMNFYNKFLAYCASKGLKYNTIGRDIKCIKAWMNAALRDGITKEVGHKHRDFKELATDVDTVYLTESEITAVQSVRLNSRQKEACRFWWLAGYYTGLRISDWGKITLKAIKSGMLDVVPQKTQERVAIAIHPDFKKLVAAYNELPSIPAEPVLNREIKLICEAAGIKEEITIKEHFVNKIKTKTVLKYQMVTSHTARRSFATNLYLAGFPAIGIMKITGHRTEKAFMKYIRITPRDTANQLAAFWANKPNAGPIGTDLPAAL